MNLPIGHISYKWNHSVCPFVSAFFHLTDVSKVRACGSRSVLHAFLWLNNILLYEGPHSVDLLVCDGHLGCFPLSATVHMGVQAPA